MSGKLDQSLDEILQKEKMQRRSMNRPGRRAPKRSAPVPPAGGIKKSSKGARNTAKPTPAKGAGLTGESKIMVSNLVCQSFDAHSCRRPSPLTLR
jgi:THO complex subunit 4